MILRWTENEGGWWKYPTAEVTLRAYCYVSSAGPVWTWQITTPFAWISSRRTYKTAAGARAACERVARRLGVAS